MKESNQQLLSSTDTVGVLSRESEEKVESGSHEPFGSFVALRRLSKVDVEAVRMQGCADGAGYD